MKIEQAGTGETSDKVKTLIEEFMTAERVVFSGYGYSQNELENQRQKLKDVKQEINQVIARLGNTGVSVFFGELEKREQEANKQYDSDVHEYCMQGQADPNMVDFYDNEVRASHQGLNKDLRSIGSVRTFLQQIQTSQTTP